MTSREARGNSTPYEELQIAAPKEARNPFSIFLIEASLFSYTDISAERG
jgi:hypothetical protein